MDDRCFIPPYVINNSSPVMALSQTIDWGLLSLKITDLHAKGLRGQGVKIGILDTGVNLKHPDLKIQSATDFTNSGTPEDVVGHGTHVAGIIGAQGNSYGVLGVAPDAEIHTYKVMADGSGSLLDVAKAITAATNDGMHILNMSLGSSASHPMMQQACRYAKSRGVILVCSSGNSGKEQIFYPSGYEECYATGAINKSMEVSAFSSYGSQLEFVAPGEKILSTYLKGGYAILSGTSMSAPFAAGCLAIMKQAGVTMTYPVIVTSVIDIDDPHFDKTSGYGILNPHITIDSLGTSEPEDVTVIKKELDSINTSVDIIMGMIQ